LLVQKYNKLPSRAPKSRYPVAWNSNILSHADAEYTVSSQDEADAGEYTEEGKKQPRIDIPHTDSLYNWFI
jgi:hypothetical protein